MMIRFEKIQFQGREYWMDVTSGESLAGAIIPQLEDFQHGRRSFAHLSDGQIYNDGKVIGSESEITHLGEFVEDPPLFDDFDDNVLEWLLGGE